MRLKSIILGMASFPQHKFCKSESLFSIHWAVGQRWYSKTGSGAIQRAIDSLNCSGFPFLFVMDGILGSFDRIDAYTPSAATILELD
jgi:hypothetical protein